MGLKITCVNLTVQSQARIYSCQLLGKLRLENTLEQRKLGSDGH